MPFYNAATMKPETSEKGPAVARTIPGELMKAGVMTYELGEGPNPHVHPNEEQFVYVLSGKLNMILGDEIREMGPGDIAHIPRNVRHGVRCTEGPATFFTVKSPAGDGDLYQDYNEASDAKEAWKKLSG